MKTVRFAFVGLGNIAKTHIVALKAMPVIKKLPFQPVLDTLVTRNLSANENQARAMGFAHVTDSLSEALKDREFEVVDICTPNAMHLEAVRHAAAADKILYCEKPLTDTYENSAELVRTAGDRHPHQVALVYRYHPAVMRLKEAVRLGLIGEVLQIKLSYRRSGYLDAKRPVSWRLKDDLSGGGAISDLGVHVLDLIRHVFGEISQVEGTTNVFVKERPVAQGSAEKVGIRVDDWALMNVTLDSGIKGTAEVSRIAWGSEAFDVEVFGTEGSLICNLEKDSAPRIKRLDGSAPAIPAPSSLELIPDEKSTMGFAMDAHFGGLNHFLHRIAGEERWIGLAPTLGDCLIAEKWIDRVLKQSGR